MNRDHAFDQLAKAVAERSITRRTAVAAFAGIIVTGTYPASRHRSSAKPLISAAPEATGPDCNLLGPACDILCALELAACEAACGASLGAACAACLKAAYSDCNNCPDAWHCTCPGGGYPCNGQNNGGPGPCCDPGQTCFDPGICQGP
jgi:hypothetical protein